MPLIHEHKIKVNLDTLNNIIGILLKANKNNNKIFAIGNGGSLSIAEHFISDIIKGADKGIFIPIDAECLGSNQVELTAEINDNGQDTVFVNMLKRRKIKAGDVLVSFSVSGKSSNVNKARDYALNIGMTVISIVGFGDNISDCENEIPVFVEADHSNGCNYGDVEASFSYLAHLIANSFRKQVKEFYGF
jgi:phosphoheptose isomerase